MWCKTSSILISFVVVAVSGIFAFAACPSADLTGDCFVDYEDFALMAAQWLTTDPCIPDDMAYIPDGTFEMGDSFDEGRSHEMPVHTVTVDSFFMGKYKITNEQYCDYLNSAYDACDIKVDGGVVYAFSDSNSFPYCDTHDYDAGSQIDYSTGVFSVRTKSGRYMSNDPMVQVSWYGAAAYCNWRSQEEGYQVLYDSSDPNWPCDFSKNGYRLATEAEREFAASGGLFGRRFPWGDTISHNQANYYCWWPTGSPQYPYDVNPTDGYHPTWDDGVEPYTSPGGTFSANGYGLFDMAGNAFEWCNDWFDPDYYDYSPTSNPIGPAAGIYRVLRGGSWWSYATHSRVAYRFSVAKPDSRWGGGGFRIALPN